MKRTAESTWTGSGKEGSGHLSTQSGAFDKQPYSFKMRFENEDGKQGTNPEELIGAAHAGCFNMALAVELGKQNIEPQQLHTVATVHLNKTDAGFAIEEIHLKLRARIRDISEEDFKKLASGAKENCPVSKLLKPGTKIVLDAELES